MPALKGTIVAQRPQAEVFDCLTEVSRHGEWSPKPWRVEGDPGRLTVGTKFSSHGWVPGDKDHLNEVEVIECTAPSRISWSANEKEGRFVSTFVLTSDGSGTKVERIFEIPTLKGFNRVMFPLFSVLIVKPNFTKGLKLLKQRLES